MRSVALLLTSVLTTGLVAVGCTGSEPEDSGTVDSDLSNTGSCRVIHEDREVAVLRGPDGRTMYAPKQLHIVEVRIAPAGSSQAPEWSGSRFASGHIQYTLAARTRPDALARLGQLVGPGTPMATVTLDPKSAAVDTAILPASTASRAGEAGAAVVELNDNPSTVPTPLLDAALRKQLVIGARANATITCGPNAIALSMTASGSVPFDVDVAKVLEPSTDLAAIESFLGTAKAIRGDALKDPLAKVNSPDLNAKMTAFAGVVETELRPILDSYGATMTRAEMKAHLQKAYDAYRDLSALVLTAAKDTKTVNDLQQRNSDGSYSFAANTTPIVTELLPSANVLRASVENALAESGDGWVNKSLQ